MKKLILFVGINAITLNSFFPVLASTIPSVSTTTDDTTKTKHIDFQQLLSTMMMFLLFIII